MTSLENSSTHALFCKGFPLDIASYKLMCSGTTERIGLVTGDAPALKQVFQFMTEKTYEFPVPKDMAIINGDRHKQVTRRNQV